MVQFSVFTKLILLLQQNDEILAFFTSFFITYDVVPTNFFCISTFTYENSLILKISSSSFKPFRSYSFFFFELYSYIIRFLETLYTSDVTDSGTHSLRYPILFASILVICPTLKIHNFSAFEYFLMRFFLLSSYG